MSASSTEPELPDPAGAAESATQSQEALRLLLHTTPDEERRRRRRAWTAIVLLMIILSLAYSDRSALAVGATEIRASFHLNPVTYGAISSIFAWPYAIALLIMGPFVDRFGSRWLLSLGTMLFSAAQLLTGFVTGVWQFFVLRVLLGVGESPGFTSAARATKMWFKDEEQGLPTGLWNSTSALGPAIAPLLFTPLMLALGWRGMFVTLGIIGGVMAVVWLVYYRERKPLAVVDGQVREVHVDSSHKINPAEWGRIFRHRSARFLAIGAFLGGYQGFTLITWLPQYFEVSRQVSVAETGVLASLPYLAGFFGAVIGGRFPDVFTRRGLDRITSCKIGLAGGAIISAVLVVPALLSHSLLISVIFLTLSGFFGPFSSSNAWTTIEAVSPASRVGSVGGIWDFGGFLGSGVGPVATGFLLQLSGGFVLPLLVGALGVVGAAFTYWFGVRGRVPDPELPEGAIATV